MSILSEIRKECTNSMNVLKFKLKGIDVPSSARMYGDIRLSLPRNASVSFGENVTIVSNWKYNGAGAGNAATHLYVKDKGKLTIGNNSGISNSVICATTSVTIGANVNIGTGCAIYDSDFHSVCYEQRINNTGVKSAPIVIQDGVWIGASSMILKGVTIGERSVVAAGSIVTKNIPSDELWGGVPAAFIKKL